MNDKLRVVLDTTVFCGALVNPNGKTMQCLLLANGPFFIPVVAQTVLAEFVHVATYVALEQDDTAASISMRTSSVF